VIGLPQRFALTVAIASPALNVSVAGFTLRSTLHPAAESQIELVTVPEAPAVMLAYAATLPPAWATSLARPALRPGRWTSRPGFMIAELR
jgi:hypothetical protein